MRCRARISFSSARAWAPPPTSPGSTSSATSPPDHIDTCHVCRIPDGNGDTDGGRRIRCAQGLRPVGSCDRRRDRRRHRPGGRTEGGDQPAALLDADRERRLRARIQELPDANAAESVSRLPGVSLIRTGGEGAKVVIRGLSPQYNQVTIDGVELPSNVASSNNITRAVATRRNRVEPWATAART